MQLALDVDRIGHVPYVPRPLAPRNPTMLTARRLLTTALLAVSIGYLSSERAVAACQATSGCADRPASGLWKLPTSRERGWIAAQFGDPATAVSFRLIARLRDEPSNCSTCIQGAIDGFLDRSPASTEHFTVRGEYEGRAAAGAGEFILRVYSSMESLPVGQIHGSFHDAPGDGSAGRFSGEWRICR
jgi:hypothetical protein